MATAANSSTGNNKSKPKPVARQTLAQKQNLNKGKKAKAGGPSHFDHSISGCKDEESLLKANPYARALFVESKCIERKQFEALPEEARVLHHDHARTVAAAWARYKREQLYQQNTKEKAFIKSKLYALQELRKISSDLAAAAEKGAIEDEQTMYARKIPALTAPKVLPYKYVDE